MASANFKVAIWYGIVLFTVHRELTSFARVSTVEGVSVA